jgi:inner membrane protein
VDNVTHAFVGAAIGECVAPKGATARTRALLMGVGIVAANAPDIDLVYSNIIEEPLGYLLHHRGHSHTWPGLAALGLLIWGGLRLFPSTREVARGSRSRWLWLLAAALASHLVMDTANGYGAHLFYPLSSRWVYGDSVFVLEPSLWAILGATLALNAGRTWRLTIVLLTLFLIGTLAYMTLLPTVVAVLILVVVTAAAVAVRTWDRKQRAASVLLLTAAIFLMMAGVSRAAKAEARRAVAERGGGEVIDVVADANPGTPWCWAVLTLERTSRDPHGTLVARRGTVSLLPSLWSAPACASARLGASRWSTDVPATDVMVWHRVWTIDLESMRALYASNCRVRAWLQFGRVPYLDNGAIVDLRFENPIGQNFTPMTIDSGQRGCPSYLTDWVVPREDVLGQPSIE